MKHNRRNYVYVEKEIHNLDELAEEFSDIESYEDLSEDEVSQISKEAETDHKEKKAKEHIKKMSEWWIKKK